MSHLCMAPLDTPNSTNVMARYYLSRRPSLRTSVVSAVLSRLSLLGHTSMTQAWWPRRSAHLIHSYLFTFEINETLTPHIPIAVSSRWYLFHRFHHRYLCVPLRHVSREGSTLPSHYEKSEPPRGSHYESGGVLAGTRPMPANALRRTRDDIPKSITLWCSLKEKNIRYKNLPPL